MLGFTTVEHVSIPDGVQDASRPNLVWTGSQLRVYEGAGSGLIRYTLTDNRLSSAGQGNTSSSDSYAQLVLEGAQRFVETRHVERLTDDPGSAGRGEIFFSGQGGFEGGRLTLMAVEHAGQTLYISSLAGGTGLGVLQYDGSSQFTSLYFQFDTLGSYAQDAHVLASLSGGSGRSFVFAGSLTEGGVSSYEVVGTALALRDSLGASEGVGINAPSALQVVETGGVSMLLVAASVTNSISVMGISDAGGLSLLDHVMDDLGTRFGGVSQMEAITIDGHVFVVAGGDDGGLTLFRLLPDGQLLHLESMADRIDLGLSRINGLHLEHVADALHVFVTSESRPGITHLTVNLEQLGQSLFGGAGSDELTGDAADDQIWGGAGNDVLNSGDGDDVLIGGAGRDLLSGGAGADLFVSDAAYGRDDILDFELGLDRIDLSAWGRLYSVADLLITSLEDGARIRFGDHELVVRSADGTSLNYEDFLAVDVFGLYRPPMPLDDPIILTGTPLADTLSGTGGDDSLSGLSGEDTIEGGAGNDTLCGGRDDDVIFGGIGADVILADAGSDEVYGGDGADVLLGGDGADVLRGEAANDTLEGESGLDLLEGGDGHDSLVGGIGIDTLHGDMGNDTIFSNSAADLVYGGAGNDSISGGAGADTLYGDAGNDEILGRTGADTIYGGSGADSIVSSAGKDSIFGENGDDTISAGSARDSVYGGAGDDVLQGNTGSDLIDGGDDNDEITGGGGADTIYGGLGNDTIFGNQGFDWLEGGAGDDELRGGTQADTFVFNRGHDRDVIADFRPGVDSLALSVSLVEGTDSAGAVVKRYASVILDGVYLDFGNGDSILLRDIGATQDLVQSIEIF